MAGFTAINTPTADVSLADQPETHSTVSKRTRSTSSTTASKNLKTVASGYLGRGTSDVTSAEIKEGSGIRRRSGTKTPRGAGQKRSGTTSSQQSAKRRKTDDVAAGMPITKPVAKAKKKASGDPSSLTIVSGANASNPDASSPSYITAPVNQQQMVSVVTSTTSMKTLHSSPLRTSLDALRSSGQSATVYQGAENRAKEPIPELQISHVSQKQAIQKDASQHARVLRPLNANAAPTITDSYNDEAQKAHDDDAKSTPRPSRDNKQPSTTDRSMKSATKSKLGRTHHPKSTGTSRTLSEDFIGEDDEEGLIEALDQADVTKARSEVITKRRTSLSNESQRSGVANHDKSPHVSGDDVKRSKRKATPILGPEDEFLQLCDEDEVDIVELTDNVEENAIQRSPTPPRRNNKLNLREVDPHEDYGGALLSDTDRQLLARMKSSKTTDRPVILRKPFPTAILDRSPIFGATNTTTLRTCFRLGEALNVGSNAVRTNSNVILELYARVSSSYREGRKQYFLFRDLYHDNPPYLEGIFELWQQSPLWDLDGRAFLGLNDSQSGTMCRLTGKMKKEAEPGGVGKIKYRLDVLSIWEASWEDVDYVAGIYARD